MKIQALFASILSFSFFLACEVEAADFKIADQSKAFCLGGAASSELEVTMLECSDAKAMKFSISQVDNGEFANIAAPNSRCLDSYWSNDSRNPITLSACTSSSGNQRFQVKKRGDGTVTFVYDNDRSLCLDLNFYKARKLSGLILYGCDDNAVSQRFRLIP